MGEKDGTRRRFFALFLHGTSNNLWKNEGAIIRSDVIKITALFADMVHKSTFGRKKEAQPEIRSDQWSLIIIISRRKGRKWFIINNCRFSFIFP
jgi:hypothetical protein